MANCMCRLLHILFDSTCNVTIKRCRCVLAFMAFCVGTVTLTVFHAGRTGDIHISCTRFDPIYEGSNSVTVFRNSQGGVMEVHNFYVDDRDNPAILRGFAKSNSEEDLVTTPSTIYSLVWFSSFEPPASTLCHVKDHNLPLPVLERDYTHVIECTLLREGGVMPNYVSMTQELCGDPLTYLPVKAFEQMDTHVVEFFSPS